MSLKDNNLTVVFSSIFPNSPFPFVCTRVIKGTCSSSSFCFLLKLLLKENLIRPLILPLLWLKLFLSFSSTTKWFKCACWCPAFAICWSMSFASVVGLTIGCGLSNGVRVLVEITSGPTSSPPTSRLAAPQIRFPSASRYNSSLFE